MQHYPRATVIGNIYYGQNNNRRKEPTCTRRAKRCGQPTDRLRQRYADDWVGRTRRARRRWGTAAVGYVSASLLPPTPPLPPNVRQTPPPSHCNVDDGRAPAGCWKASAAAILAPVSLLSARAHDTACVTRSRVSSVTLLRCRRYYQWDAVFILFLFLMPFNTVMVNILCERTFLTRNPTFAIRF